MSYRPKMIRENEAYGWLPEDEAAYSDNELAPERSTEEYHDDFGKK